MPGSCAFNVYEVIKQSSHISQQRDRVDSLFYDTMSQNQSCKHCCGHWQSLSSYSFSTFCHMD